MHDQRDSPEIDAVSQLPAHPLLWLLTATLTGAIIMSLELTAFRLYAPYFGYSIYVWGSTLSVAMLALAIGYAFGGWVADRTRSETLLYLIILGSGLYQLASIAAVRPVLRWLWQRGEFVGSTTASLIIFVPTMTALAVTVPFVIRLLARAGHIGVTAGRVYALSTAGSIAGVLATSFFMIPRFGTRITLQALCAVTLLVGGAGLLRRSKIAVLVLLPAIGALLLPKLTFAPPVLWTTESAYNWIAVLQTDGLRWLALNHPGFFQTVRKKGSSWSGFYTDDFALGAALTPARNMLALGMGAGGGIASTIAVAPELHIDAVEIDPKVVQTAIEFFGLPVNQGNLVVHIADARPWLASHAQRYDVVQVDLYQGGPYIPFYLITAEFFGEARSRVTDDGLLMVNIYDTSASRELLMSAGATIRQAFPSVQVISRPDGNHVVLAFAQEVSVAGVQERLRGVKSETAFHDVAQHAAAILAELRPPPGTLVFTDDRAPVEEMTRRMLLTQRR